jgi:acyl-CoA synthetase (NDP forming)
MALNRLECNPLNAARKQNRTLLLESESKQILRAYGIPVAGVTVETIRRQDGYELMMGSRIDPQFGPVLRFGTGGTLGKVMKDYALGLPPLKVHGANQWPSLHSLSATNAKARGLGRIC